MEKGRARRGSLANTAEHLLSARLYNHHLPETNRGGQGSNEKYFRRNAKKPIKPVVIHVLGVCRPETSDKEEDATGVCSSGETSPNRCT